jgi:crossover junction endodeoxyribonuclease RuvC
MTSHGVRCANPGFEIQRLRRKDPQPSDPGATIVLTAGPIRILGLDPGLQVTGYGVIEVGDRRPVVCEAGVVRGTDRPSAKLDITRRLSNLYSGIVEVIEQFAPSAMAVEQLYAHYEHPRTAILMGHARGVLLLAAGQRGIPVTSYNATRIKKTITGHGRASKAQMQHAMLRELGLATLPEPADVADALAAALCHYYAVKLTA